MLEMERLTGRIQLMHFSICVLFTSITGYLSGQDQQRYSEFRNQFFVLAIDYKLDEALALCNSREETNHEVLAGKSIVYSLMGNRDKNESLIKKGFDIVKPYQSLEDDYNIHAALAISYGMQANHAGLKEKNEEKAMFYYQLAHKNERHNDDDHKAEKDLQKKLK